jgi:hypothetical protein
MYYGLLTSGLNDRNSTVVNVPIPFPNHIISSENCQVLIYTSVNVMWGQHIMICTQIKGYNYILPETKTTEKISSLCITSVS